MTLLFCFFLVLGFVLWDMATWPNASRWLETAARSCFLICALIFAFGALGGHLSLR